MSAVLHTKNGISTNSREFGDILDGLKGLERRKPLLLWFHGGLVSSAAGEATAARVGGYLDSKGQFPIFLVWESGIWPTLQDAIVAMLRRKLLEGVTRLVTGLLAVKRAIPGLGVAVASDQYVLTPEDEAILQEAAEASPEFQQEALALDAPTAFAADADPATREVDAKVRAALEREAAAAGRPHALGMGIPGWLTLLGRILIRIARAVLERFRRHRDHEIGPTILEETARQLEIGKDIWDEMKRDSAANFVPGGGGYELLQRLQTAGELKDRPIVLVGHSTGAILMHHTLEAMHKLGIEAPVHLRYLAPAARCDLAVRTMEEFGEKIASVRVFAMQDRYERVENLLEDLAGTPAAFLKGAYRGSLLYFVSGALEAESDAPIFGMQRFLGGDATFLNPEEASCVERLVAAIEAKDPQGFVWTRTDAGGVAGYQGQSLSHGGFDDVSEQEANGAIASLLVGV